MPLWNQYFIAHSVEDALQVLNDPSISSRVIAGGTDLLLDLQQGRQDPVDTLIDINSVPEMTGIESHNGTLYIGAAVPLERIIDSALVQEHAQCLIDACGLMSGPQVRNVATLGGNLTHALPAADGTIALMALDARVEIACLAGRRVVPLESLFVSPGHTSLNPKDDLLVNIQLPLREKGQASAFNRVMRSQGIALPILNCGVWIERSSDAINDIRIVVAPAGPTPLRAVKVEDTLLGRELTGETLTLAKDSLRSSVNFRNSPRRATSEYRYHLASILFEDVISKAWMRADVGNDDS